jgi:hypothetical protein
MEQLREALDGLSSMIVDADALRMFLTSYPRLYRRPYSMHILLSNCMFGCHLEEQLVVKFLLHIQPHDAEELEVLPIVGPGKVGKSTLVAMFARMKESVNVSMKSCSCVTMILQMMRSLLLGKDLYGNIKIVYRAQTKMEDC